MEISNSRRILVVASESETEMLSRFIKDLTGTHPTPSSSSAATDEDSSSGLSGLAGTTHVLPIKTAYYSASVPMWLDTVASPASDWAESFLSEEAREVLGVLGGVVVVFPLSAAEGEDGGGRHQAEKTARELVAAVGRVVCEGLGDWSWDGVGLAVGVGDVTTATTTTTTTMHTGGGGGGAGEEGDRDLILEWDGRCGEVGLEFVHVKPGLAVDHNERDEFGEKTGLPRVLEALESNDWNLPSTGPDMEDEDDGDQERDSDDDDDEFGDFAEASASSSPAAAAAGGKRARRRKSTDLDPEALGFGFDKADFEGLKAAIWSSGGVGVEEDEDPDGSVFLVENKKKKDEVSEERRSPLAAAAGGQKPESSRDSAAKFSTGDHHPSSSSKGEEGEEDWTKMEMEMEMGEEDVEKVEAMMRKLLAVRDLSAGLPEEQRRRLAARAVDEVMKEL